MNADADTDAVVGPLCYAMILCSHVLFVKPGFARFCKHINT